MDIAKENSPFSICSHCPTTLEESISCFSSIPCFSFPSLIEFKQVIPDTHYFAKFTYRIHLVPSLDAVEYM